MIPQSVPEQSQIATTNHVPEWTPELRARAEERAARDKAEAEIRAQRKAQAEAQRVAANTVPAVEPVSFQTSTKDESMYCIDCDKPFVAKVLVIGRASVGARVCPGCQEIRNTQANNRDREQREQRRRETWLDLCPEEYLSENTDLGRTRRELSIPGIEIVQIVKDVQRTLPVETYIDLVLNWDLNTNGLAILGESGRHKTRLCFMMLERWHMKGQIVRYVNAADLSDTISSLYGQSAQAGDLYVRKLSTAPILFIDDLGKGKMTERGEESLYRILEHRYKRRMKLVTTLNCTGKELMKQFSADRAVPILRRLRELTQTIAILE